MTDTTLPDIWLMDPKVQFIDDIKPLQDTELYRVRRIEGVEWAVPLYVGEALALAMSSEVVRARTLRVEVEEAVRFRSPPTAV